MSDITPPQWVQRVLPKFDASGLPVNDGPHRPSDAPPIPQFRSYVPQGIAALAANFGSDDDALSSCHPDDRITGAPHHYVLNGDHSECGCGGDHLIECAIWNEPHWRHVGSICGVARTLCNHRPRHRYGQPCDDYAADPLQAVGRPQGCIAHGGPDCVCEVEDGPAQR